MKRGSGVFIALAVIAQSGCAAPKVGPSPALPPPAPEVAIERPAAKPLPGLIVSEIEGKKEAERLYSFSLRDADIREVLMAIAKQTDFNIVVDPDVQGRVTVDLKNVSFTEALDTLTELLDLNYRVRQNLIRVSRPAVETRIFSLHYVNLKRSGSSSTTAQIGTGTSAAGTASSGTGSGVAGTVGATGGAAGVAGSQGGGGSGGGGGQTAVNTSTDTDLWRDIDAGLTKLLSPSGKMVVDKQSGNILVADFPKFLDRIAAFLETIEGSVQRQVLIEARIIEVTLTGEYQFGLNWSAISRAGALKGLTTIAPTRMLAQSLAPAESSFQFGVTSTDFEVLLKVLQTQGEVNVLSSPKLATLNNQTAVIRSATDEVFFEPRVVLVPSGDTVVQTTDVTTRTVTIGVVLSVTPQISADGSIVLHVRPTVTDTTRRETFTQQATGTTGAFTITVPVVDVREADVIVRAREGEIVVIGGLIQERKSSSESRVPLLADIPGIGRLFRSTIEDRRKTELVVFLSPTVMVGKKIDEVATRELDRLKKSKGSSPW